MEDDSKLSMKWLFMVEQNLNSTTCEIPICLVLNIMLKVSFSYNPTRVTNFGTSVDGYHILLCIFSFPISPCMEHVKYREIQIEINFSVFGRIFVLSVMGVQSSTFYPDSTSKVSRKYIRSLLKFTTERRSLGSTKIFHFVNMFWLRIAKI